MMAQDYEEFKRKIFPLYIGLLEKSRDLGILDADIEFTRSDWQNEILYIVDANILIRFLEPVASDEVGFHHKKWNLDSTFSDETRTQWSTIQKICSALTCEYIFSGDLPGQIGRSFYITEEHLDEMQRIAIGRFSKFQDTVNDLSEDKEDPIDEILLQGREDMAGKVESVRSYVQDSIEISGFETKLDNAIIDTFRDMAFLVEDKLIEPVRQLERLTSGEFQSRLPMVSEIPEIGKINDEEFSNRQNDWFDEIVAEFELQGFVVPQDQEEEESLKNDKASFKSRVTIQNDAKAIAACQLLNQHNQNAKRRFVFLTTDNVLQRVYRKVSGNPENKLLAGNELNFIRHIGSYAPIHLNLALASPKEDESRQEKSFRTNFENTIEQIMLPMNLSYSSNRDDNHSTSRTRDDFLLDTMSFQPINEQGSKLLMQAMQSLWMGLPNVKGSGSEHLGYLSKVLMAWREMELFSIEAQSNLLQERLKQFEVDQQEIRGTDENPQLAIRKYLIAKSEDLLELVSAWALPMANNMIETWSQSQRPSRIPVIIVGRGEDDHLDSTKDVADGERLVSSLKACLALDDPSQETHAEYVFGIASGLSLLNGDWSNATHFSATAAKAIEIEIDGANAITNPYLRSEINYIAALARRARVGDIGVPRTAGQRFRVEAEWRRGLNYLRELTGIDNSIEDKTDTRRLRRVSERAALNLSFAWSLFLATQNQRQKNNQWLAPEISMEKCRECIVRSWDLLQNVERDLEQFFQLSNEVRAEHFNLLNQTMGNSLSTYLLRRLIGYSDIVPLEEIRETDRNQFSYEERKSELFSFFGSLPQNDQDNSTWTMEWRAFQFLLGQTTSFNRENSSSIISKSGLKIDTSIDEAICCYIETMLPDGAMQS